MNVIIYNKQTKEIKEDHYPRVDISEPIEGLDPNIEIYFINEQLVKNPNTEQYYIQYADELINETHQKYKHLKICNRKHYLVEKNKDEVIQKLNDELGIYVDREYPIWERNKHLQEFLFEATEERINYIKELSAWLMKCRELRNEKEKLYLEDPIKYFPDFYNYPPRP
jgi:hypothetical protein